MRRLTLFLAGLLLAGACSSGAPNDARTAPSSAPVESPGASETVDAKKEARSRGDEARESKKSTAKKSKDDGSPVATAKSGGGSEGSTSRKASVPPPGTFSFAQSGWEEFCQAGNCDRNQLPKDATVRLDRGSEPGRFTATTRSGSTEQTISYSLKDDVLSIERIATQTTYQGFTTEVVVDPSPAIIALRFPIRDGRTWSGSWKGSEGPDGSYSATIVERTTTTLRGKQEAAFVLQLDLFFKGEIDGFTKVEAVVATRDLMILSTRGRTEASSQFGTYRSEFSSEYHG